MADAPTMIVRALLVWLVIVGAETLHGTARSLWLMPFVGDAPARRIAVFTGSLIILLIALSTVRWIGARSRRALLAIGLLWVILMLAFDITLGRFGFRYSWSRIGEDFNLAQGGLLPIGMLVLGLSPFLAAKFRAGIDGTRSR